ncbi:unnamed protein product [Ectocarpus sp. 4 AP-2014]
MANASSPSATAAAAASPPSFTLDLGKRRGDQFDCFLLGYKRDDGSLDDLALVSGNAVYSAGSGLKSCVHKPLSKKQLTAEVHLSKVLCALESVAAAASSPAYAGGSAASEGSSGIPSNSNSGGPVATASSTTAVIMLEKVEKDAVLTVKEVSKVGPVKLATVTLPSLGHEAGGGGSLIRALLLGAVRKAHKRTRDAEGMRRERDRAVEEKVRVQELLDSTLRNKEKTISSILERAALVINAKKARITTLEFEIQQLEQSGRGDSEGGEGASSGYDSNGDDEYRDESKGGQEGDGDPGDEGTPPPGNGKSKSKGKGKAVNAQPRGAGVAPAAASSKPNDTEAGRVATGGGQKGVGGSPSGKGGGAGRGGVKVKAKTEPAFMGAGGGALAVPIGTQEVSGEDLSIVVDAKIKLEGNDGRDGSGANRKRSRPQGSVSPSPNEPVFRDSHAAGGDSGSGGRRGGAREAAMYLGSDDDEGIDEDRTPAKSRRRRVRKKPAASTANGEGGGGGDGNHGSEGAAAAVPANSRPTQQTTFAWTDMLVDDDNSDDLDGMR